MSDRIIRTKELMHKSGLTRASLYRKRQTDPHFPKPIKLGDNSVGFSEKESDDYIQMLIETRGIYEIVT